MCTYCLRYPEQIIGRLQTIKILSTSNTLVCMARQAAWKTDGGKNATSPYEYARVI